MKSGIIYPDRLIMRLNIDGETADLLAAEAVEIARTIMPKLTGRAASLLTPVAGEGFFGLRWTENYVWFQEKGINPFTMRSLAGKVIPMWIDDPTGEEARKNPKAKTRITASGRTQVLIFRRAAKQGQRKTVNRGGQEVSVPASYPGAPGRIALREAARPWTRTGKVGGRIAATNVGVRWRHPGLFPRYFLHHAIEQSAIRAGIRPERIIATHQRMAA